MIYEKKFEWGSVVVNVDPESIREGAIAFAQNFGIFSEKEHEIRSLDDDFILHNCVHADELMEEISYSYRGACADAVNYLSDVYTDEIDEL